MTSGLTEQQRSNARLILEGKIQGREACIHCGGIHLRACRRVKRAEWHSDGTLLKVWYWPDGKWDESEIVWPEDAYDDDLADERKLNPLGVRNRKAVAYHQDHLAQQCPIQYIGIRHPDRAFRSPDSYPGA